MTVFRRGCMAVLFCALLFTLCPSAFAADTNAPATLRQLARAIDQRTRQTDAMLALDRQALRRRVAELRKSLAAEKKRLQQATVELTKLRAKHEELVESYDRAAADMRMVEDAVRTNAVQFADLLSKSAATSLAPDRLAPLKRITDSTQFPGVKEITALGALMLDEIRTAATAQRIDGTFLGPDGEARHGHLLRTGSLFLGAQDDQGRTFLLLPGATPPAAVANTPGKAADTIAAWAAGTSDLLPLDPSQGAALSLLQARRTLNDWFESGGLLLWPIIAVGVMALLAILYKGVMLFNTRPSPKNFSRRLRRAWDEGQREGVDTLLRSLPRVPAARALLAITHTAPPEQYDKEFQEGFLAELRRLESLLGFIAVMAAVAPLLGLLGTVTGMIDSFQAITIFGSSNPRIMAGGISEALITTQAGLGVAIPVLFLHQLLKQRVQSLAADMEQQGAALLTLMAGKTPQPKGTEHA